MSMIDIAGGASLPKLYRYTGFWPLTAGLLALLAWRAYKQRNRLADMVSGAMVGAGKLPAMALPLLRPGVVRKSRKVKRTRRRHARRARVRSHANASHAIH
jgi:hypothetical protein